MRWDVWVLQGKVLPVLCVERWGAHQCLGGSFVLR